MKAPLKTSISTTIKTAEERKEKLLTGVQVFPVVFVSLPSLVSCGPAAASQVLCPLHLDREQIVKKFRKKSIHINQEETARLTRTACTLSKGQT